MSDVNNNCPNTDENLATERKVLLHLRAVGEASSLKRNKFKLNGTKTILDVQQFLLKSLGHTNKSVYIYCGTGFSPTPDQLIQDLYDNFQTNGEVIITYGIQETWG